MPPFIYPTPEPTDSPSSRDESSKRRLEDCNDTTAPHSREPKRQRVSVQCGTLCFPPSHYSGARRRQAGSDREAINALAIVWNSQDRSQHEYNIWYLKDYSVYRNGTNHRHAFELCPLHLLKNEDGVNELLFDGILSIDGEERRVEGVPFDCLAIDGYGDENDKVSACIQTTLGCKASVWYQLGTPANHYTRYHDTFLWVSRFTKYVVDFLEDSEQSVTFSVFRRTFYPYLQQKYGSSPAIKDWLDQHHSHDFGQAFCANLGFIIKECYSVNDQLLDEPIFGETNTKQLKAIKMEDTAYKNTVVTPFVFELFRKMPFQGQMQVLSEVSVATLRKQESRRIELGLTPLSCRPTLAPKLRPHKRIVRRGDVVSIAAETQTQWRHSTGVVWFAYVQEIRRLKSGVQKLDVLWLYEPSDTTLGHGYYPYKNELFLSDNCSCGKNAIDAELVQSIVTVKWFANNPGESKDCFFVRQKFRTEPTLGAYDFVQLKQSDFSCGCNNTETEMYRVKQEFAPGDTVLVYRLVHGKESLEPAIIRGFNRHTVTLQTFLRCHRDLYDKHAAANQIMLTDEMFDLDPDSVTRHCRVATFASLEDVRTPYDRNGAGDLWYVVSSSAPTWNFVDQEIAPESKLKGMGIFCGSGSFDRGLEEGGGLEFNWAVDWAERALHSYRANTEEPERLNLFLGSVNDYLSKAIHGTKDSRIATVGDVDLLAAGSPCPGFSVLQRDRHSVQSLRNCSLVASVCSYVDLYMPKYLVLENVIGMARNPGKAKDLNVFSQVLCCLISMGYSVQQLLMDPGHYGSCQSRQRIFIIATAPGHKVPIPPPQTHTCKELETYSRAIGYASNGLPFGKRKHDVCPFVSLTAKEAFQDLPDIGDSHVQTCIPAPDHRTCRHESARKRALIQMIPRWPYGQSFVKAVNAGKMSHSAISNYAWQNKNRSGENSKSWSRIFPDRLIGCLTTDIKPHDSFLGRTLHYDQHRTMTVMEARRVQGLPDDEIVLGTPAQQWNQIGNGVDRKVAFALGMQLAEAHRKNMVTRRDAPALLPIVEETSSPRTISVIHQELVLRDSLQSVSCKSPGAVTFTEKQAVSNHIVQQTGQSATQVIDLEMFEVSLADTQVPSPMVQEESTVSIQQEVWKGGVECIIID
ncbi:S-adenosyl-L-methionine-dependent methyltransferase [Aureobasidium sp. EXF-3400]|jgi:DNA (cytosine-5)-methyltransferase 1|nr:S-adenosyl-L-methionine-dependent methyltransferase [Aureobasidium sp. EXF-12344]KAI4779083.1 S-adenosyl-L-methionine-dependent methyltransferase [Aureobasidium sp. EXF-3400]